MSWEDYFCKYNKVKQNRVIKVVNLGAFSLFTIFPEHSDYPHFFLLNNDRVNTEKTFFVSHSAVLVYTGRVINISTVICPLKKPWRLASQASLCVRILEVWGDRNGAGFLYTLYLI